MHMHMHMHMHMQHAVHMQCTSVQRVYSMQRTYLERDEERPPRAVLADQHLPEHLARRRRRRRPQLEPARILAQGDHAAAELPEPQDRLTSLRPELC
jgi:hypothetical protein